MRALDFELSPILANMDPLNCPNKSSRPSMTDEGIVPCVDLGEVFCFLCGIAVVWRNKPLSSWMGFSLKICTNMMDKKRASFSLFRSSCHSIP